MIEKMCSCAAKGCSFFLRSPSVVVKKYVTFAQISFDGGYGVAQSVSRGHALSSMVVRPPDLKKFVLGVEARKNSYRDALLD